MKDLRPKSPDMTQKPGCRVQPRFWCVGVSKTIPQAFRSGAAGYFDLATPFYATEYALAHLGVDGPLRANVRIAYYPTGHMIYLDDAALHTLKRDLASFYAAGAR